MARIGRGLAALGDPRRLVALPAYVEIMLRDRAVGAAALPDPASAMTRPEGFCGAASDLAPTTLMQAYSQGLHARAPFGPASWWAPVRRLVRAIPASAAAAPEARFDLDCDHAIALSAEAAARRAPLDAASPILRHAHARLFDRGYAHCFATSAAAGGYGLAIGRAFVVLGLYGEPADAAGALAALEGELARRRFALVDLTFVRALLPDLACETMSREAYDRMLDANPDGERAARWRKTA
ncbi:MAG: hypothetical protein IPL88_12380 [Rhizobiales bacterium]|nr:hypothetical protein [Hyphomicrobiales bacterium]